MRKRKYTINVDASNVENFDPNIKLIADDLELNFDTDGLIDDYGKEQLLIEVDFCIDKYKHSPRINRAFSWLLQDYLVAWFNFKNNNYGSYLYPFFSYFISEKKYKKLPQVIKGFISSMFDVPITYSNYVEMNVFNDNNNYNCLSFDINLIKTDFVDSTRFIEIDGKVYTGESILEHSLIKPKTVLMRIIPKIYYLISDFGIRHYKTHISDFKIKPI